MNPITKTTSRVIIILIVVLALASISCNMTSVSSLFATETPIPTSTFTPTPTFTPSPTLTSTPTKTPTATPLPTGALTEEQADGSTLFVDYDNHFQILIPQGWLVLPFSSDDIVEIIENVAKENPDFKEVAKTFSQLDPDVIRIVALNENPKYLVNGFSTNLTITAIEDRLMSSMPLDFVVGAVEESLKQRGGAVVSGSQLASLNANGVEVGVFEFQQESPTVSGAKVKIQSKSLIFQSNGKLIMIQLAIPRQFAADLLPALDQIIDTIKLVGP